MPSLDDSGGSRSGGAPEPAHSHVPGQRERRRLTWEVWLIMGLTLGRSGVYALVDLIDAYTRGPIGEQTTTLNPALSARPWFDLTYQALSIVFALLPVLLAIYLVSADRPRVWRHLGGDGRRLGRDFGWGLALGAAIGVPGLGLYLLGRAAGVSLEVSASGLNTYWWTIPVLILAALKNGIVEEVLVVGYLTERLQRLRWSAPAIVILSAGIRASYHLYQGWAALAGNFLMGVIFAVFYLRRGRLWPLVIAHTLIDVAAFVGYAYLPGSWLAALGIG